MVTIAARLIGVCRSKTQNKSSSSSKHYITYSFYINQRRKAAIGSAKLASKFCQWCIMQKRLLRYEHHRFNSVFGSDD